MQGEGDRVAVERLTKTAENANFGVINLSVSHSAATFPFKGRTLSALFIGLSNSGLSGCCKRLLISDFPLKRPRNVREKNKKPEK